MHRMLANAFTLPTLRLTGAAFSLCAVLALVFPPTVAAADASPQAEAEKTGGEKVDIAAMMARAREFTQPSEKHKLLERFLGTWDIEMRITMPGMNAKPEKGLATCSWLYPDRWLQCHNEGAFMGNPVKSFYLFGYDNFKKSYISMKIDTIDTAMVTSEGDLDPGGKALVSYGTLDEYLTGEHDKMVKTIWRFVSDDEMLFEIYDLPIGEHNNQVIEMRYTRRKEGT